MRRTTRTIRRTVAVLALTMTCLVPAAAVPTAAHACFLPGNCPMYTTNVSASHTGWVTKPLEVYPCSRSGPCRVATPGYRWTGTGWTAVAIPAGWIYVTPYAPGWRWAYTTQTGWLAISTSIRLSPS